MKVATVNPTWSGDSWLLTGVIGQTAAQIVGVALWSAAFVAFSALAGVVVGWLPAAWWPSLAIGASLLSLAGVLLFPGAFPTGSTIGAVAVDVVVLVAVLGFHWAPSELPA
jgi:hypothetical protein